MNIDFFCINKVKLKLVWLISTILQMHYLKNLKMVYKFIADKI
jgi:hypothetical protein